MEDSGRWHSPNEIADALGSTVGAARKRIYRYRQRHPNSRHVRDVDPVGSGGRSRVEVHDAVLDSWRSTESETVPRVDSGEVEADNLVMLEKLQQQEFELLRAELKSANAELAHALEKLEWTQAQLTAKEFELAEQRDQLRALGETVDGFGKAIRDLTR